MRTDAWGSPFRRCINVNGRRAAFNDAADELLASSPTVRRYETHFVKREVKFAPFVELSVG